MGATTSWNSQGLSRAVQELLYLYILTDIVTWRRIYYVGINIERWGVQILGGHWVKVKVKFTLVQALRLSTGHTAHRRSRVIALLFLDHGTRRVRGDQRHAPAALYPLERPGTHCTGGWVGPRSGLDRCRKSRPPPGLHPRTFQFVASRFTDYATRDSG